MADSHYISIYISDEEWDLLKKKVQQEGQEGTDRQVSLFARQWAKAGMRMPIREELEQSMFAPRIQKEEK